jgi:transposase
MCWAAAGTTTKEIAARLRQSEHAMRMHIAALKDLPVNPTLLMAQSGGPSKTSTTQDRRLKSCVEQNLFKSARQLKNAVAGWADVSIRNIQDCLQKKMRLLSHRAAKKPLLTSA